jgi:hypothetical protein
VSGDSCFLNTLMSDNVPITPGSGAIIETIDEGGGVERQVITIGSIGDASGETQLSAGQKTSANSIPVVIASDQTTISTRPSPTSSTSFAITPGSSSTTEGSHVLKSSAGNLYSVYCLAGSTAGFLMTFNATSAPADGSVTPVECIPVAANQYASIDFGDLPDAYSTGIVAVFSTTGPVTKTVSATAFFKWRVQ